MSNRSVIFSGYVANDIGLRAWPSKTVKWRWAELTKVQTQRQIDGRGYGTTLQFEAGRKVTLRGSKFLGSTMGRYAELLALAVVGAPAETEVDALTRDIAQWGGREVQQRIRHRAGLLPSAEDDLQKARFYRVRLEERKALRTLESIIARQREHREAWGLRLQVLAESGARLQTQLTVAAEAQALFADDSEIRTHYLGLRLLANEAAVVPEVEATLAREPENFPLGFALAGYFYRQKDFERAMAVADTLGQQLGGDGEAQRAAREYREYLEQYATSGAFRAKVRLRYWGAVALALLPLLLFVGIKTWGFYDQRHRKTQQQQRQAQWQEETRARLEKMNHDFEETTGQVMGDYPAVKARADAGEANAQYTVAEQLFSGRQKAPTDPAAAVRYLELAAAQHHRAAVLDLAERLLEGKSVSRDEERGLRLLEEAVSLGSPRAASQLGGIYRQGKLVPKDEARAFALFEQSAQGGYSWAQAQLGWAREHGEGVAQDLPKALAHYRLAAEGNHMWAQERLAQLLVDKNQPCYEPVEAWKWIERGAKKGSRMLQVYYASGLMSGVEATAEERRQAVLWLSEGAAAGDAAAQYFWG